MSIRDQNYTGKELVSYSQNGLQVDGTSGSLNNCCIQPLNYWDNWHNVYYPIYYPQTHFISEKSKVEQGFKVVGKMIENKIIKKEINNQRVY